MTKKKKIGILTLRVDNNYGGHLQRYALSRVLQEMGHDACVLYFRSTWNNDSTKKRLKKAVKNIIKKLLGKTAGHILYWKHEELSWQETRKNAFPFFQRYISHSELIYSLQSLKRHVCKANYDVLIVGSDQVWRKAYTERWGVDRFFLDFAPESSKKIAYAASFGGFDMEYNEDELQHLQRLYGRLDAVSVREELGLAILEKHGWKIPKAVHVLDPTMLLPKEHYLQLINNGNTKSSNGNMFCYILDNNDNAKLVVNKLKNEKGYIPYFASIDGENRMSVEQWLRSFVDADYIVTDSYHGVVFSLIFNKPFYLISNEGRGNARFESLKQTFNLQENSEEYNVELVNEKILSLREKSYIFLRNALK